jgi:hypothetical protein
LTFRLVWIHSRKIVGFSSQVRIQSAISVFSARFSSRLAFCAAKRALVFARISSERNA